MSRALYFFLIKNYVGINPLSSRDLEKHAETYCILIPLLYVISGGHQYSLNSFDPREKSVRLHNNSKPPDLGFAVV